MPGELARILGAPVWVPDRDPARWAHLASPGAPPLRPPQAALLDAARYAREAGPGPYGPRGVVGLLGCGAGKTLAAGLLPEVLGAQRPLLLAPASLLPQTREALEGWRSAYPRVRPLEALSYSALGHPSRHGALRRRRPDLLILDEAHRCGRASSARWWQVADYLSSRWHEVRVCLLSGTLVQARTSRVGHLLQAALRDWTPLPVDRTADLWASVLDAEGEPDGQGLALLDRLGRWAGASGHRPQVRARRAWRRRLITTPGVVVAPGPVADLPLEVRTWRPPLQTPAAVREALDTLDTLWELPDGEELVEAHEHARHARTLALGLWGSWDPDTVDPEYVEARRRWAARLRALVEYGGHPSPARAEAYVERTGGRDPAYRRWAAVRDQPPPVTRWQTVAEGWLVQVVRTWLARHPRGLVWWSSLGVADALRRGGLPVHGAGSRPPRGGPAAVSQRVHGEGWDGAPAAGYTDALVLEPPSSADRWEQLLARLHRSGHRPGVARICWDVLALHPIAHGALSRALRDARAIEDATGVVQRLVIGRPAGDPCTD